MADFRLLLPDDRGIIATLDEQGVVTFVVLAGAGCPVRGHEMFDLMMRAFGERVRGIRGVWRRGHHGHESVNLDQVNDLTARGVPLAEAIERTWTVRQAKRWGFDRTTIIHPSVGIAGAYEKIDVLIEK